MDENTRVIGFPRGKFKNNRIGEMNRAICELEPPVFLVRLTAKSDTDIVKSIVKEVRDQNNKRFSYEEVGRVHLDKDTKNVRYCATQSDS